MSPELIAPARFGLKNSRPTVFSDCYALGMVIYETISGNFPFHKDADLVVLMKVVEGERPPQGVKFTKSLWEMLEWCWVPKPNDRPSIEDVLQCLEMALNASELPSPGVDEGIDVGGESWDSATSSSGGDSLDFFATKDHMEFPPTHSLPSPEHERQNIAGADGVATVESGHGAWTSGEAGTPSCMSCFDCLIYINVTDPPLSTTEAYSWAAQVGPFCLAALLQ